MAEAVGLCASIAGLATLAFQISKVGYEYINGVQNARSDIKQLVEEVTNLGKLLEQLQHMEEAGDLADTSASDPLSLLQTECKQFLIPLKAKIGGSPKKRSSRTLSMLGISKSNLKWPFKENETRKEIERIERLKSTVSMRMQM